MRIEGWTEGRFKVSTDGDRTAAHAVLSRETNMAASLLCFGTIIVVTLAITVCGGRRKSGTMPTLDTRDIPQLQ